MLLRRYEYDISFLIELIRSRRLDLQPAFQRGQVWSDTKRKKLIDSILRNWYVPPIHVVINENLETDEILDGQQRLRAIYDFYREEFSVDGNIEPVVDDIKDLDGLYYWQLPHNIRARFNRFIITTVRLEQYAPSEPGELFFRLNQPVALTSAEQRNALVGPARDQVRQLSKVLEERSEGQSLGFTNARMNFDDIISRVALTLEEATLQEKITAGKLASRYRNGREFNSEIFSRIEGGLIRIACVVQDAPLNMRFNKATLYSWIIFVIDNDKEFRYQNTQELCDFVVAFELTRAHSKDISFASGRSKHISTKLSNDGFALIDAFNDRSSSRVNDASSVVIRDFCINASYYLYGPGELYSNFVAPEKREILNYYLNELRFERPRVYEDRLEHSLYLLGWGKRI